MYYEWDQIKSASNLLKHGIRFADTVTALEDDHALTIEDDSAKDERRFVTIGMNDALHLLVVGRSRYRGEWIRFILNNVA